MSIDNLAIFQAMNRKLNYLSQRQVVISQNIANADTPDYIPQDVKGPEFRDLIEQKGGKVTLRTGRTYMHGVRAAATDGQHLQTTFSDKTIPGSDEQNAVYEVAPSGNAVDLEEQMVKASDTAMDHGLITSLYRKNVGLLRAAIGQGGQA